MSSYHAFESDSYPSIKHSRLSHAGTSGRAGENLQASTLHRSRTRAGGRSTADRRWSQLPDQRISRRNWLHGCDRAM